MSVSGALGFKKERSSGKSESDTTKSGTQTSQLELDQEGIDKMLKDLLGGAGGLADIFGGEQTAGIFNSSVSAQAAGDLTASIVGELAKLTGKTTTAFDEKGSTVGSSSSKGQGFDASLSGTKGV